MKAIIVAGTCSGVGKSSIALGLMAAYTRRGFRVQPFKIGPDFLDPLFHRAATGRDSYNLDTWLLDRDINLATFLRCAQNTDIAIVEGVMGLYDGSDGKSENGSTAEMAKLLSVPVLLVLDCWAYSRSAAAIIRGYTAFDPAVKFAGVIFNKIEGPAHKAWLTEAVLTSELINILGGIPKAAQLDLPDDCGGKDAFRSNTSLPNYIKKLSDIVEMHVDLDSTLEAAGLWDLDTAHLEHFSAHNLLYPRLLPKQVRIGVARDAAFCYFYHQNFTLLQDAGAELIFFSPLKDPLPPRLDAIYFGGGHPELHLDLLSANKQLLYAVRAFADAGGVIYGEAGGLMYLSQGIEGGDGQCFPMCSIFPFWTRVQKVLHTGYIKVVPRDNCGLFPPEVGEIRGYVYNFSEIFWKSSESMSICSKGFIIKLESSPSVEELEGYMQGNTMATFVHLHFGSNIASVHAIIDRCRKNTMKAAAVAAASAAAVAESGPEAAAAAGAAAAAAVSAALAECRELVPYEGDGTSIVTINPDKASDRSHSLQLVENTGKDDLESIMALSRSSSTNSLHRLLPQDQIRYSLEQTKLCSLERFGQDDKAKRTDANNFDGIVEIIGSLSQCLDKNTEPYRSHSNIDNFDELRIVEKEDSSFGSIPNGVLFGGRTDISPKVQNKHIKLEEIRANSQFDKLPLLPIRGRLSTASDDQPTKYKFPVSPSENFRRGSAQRHRVTPRKIVSLSPPLTEVLVELGVGNRLIGITDLCDKPVGVRSGRHIACRIPSSNLTLCFSLEKQDNTFKLDVPWLCRSKPDFVVMSMCTVREINSKMIAEALARAGLVYGKDVEGFEMNSYTLSEVWTSILDLGDLVGLYQEACLLVNSLQRRLRRISGTVAAEMRPRLLLLEGLDPLVLGGRWIPEMEALAGGYDGLQKPGCIMEILQWQRVTCYAPEVLILSPCGCSVEQTLLEVEKLASQPGFWSLPAVELRHVYICEPRYFSYAGPDLVDGVEILASILHPSTVSYPSSMHRVLKFSLKSGQRCRSEELCKYFGPLQ